ncbi:hypothetical protein EV356DRAFT_513188 [Viridothelium virens]|uniref:Uncharacterized protein n=1 Tax=Viridothelium virens TaxID=1048519 RepID=A0A6A6HEJ3_VIRVR|nr:hypothetical protein EV356DRAFT_513188 [Viridothelium virens]
MASTAPISATNTLSQSQSPFFTVLPPEIRNEIYSWALLQSEDTSQTYEENSYWSRPGFRSPLKSRSHLLRTCRLIYLEAEAILMQEAEHAFWFDRGPAERSRIEKCSNFFRALTPKNVQALNSVRFFTQMYWLEGGEDLNKIFGWPNFRPETLTITIRYSDWWFWERNEPLRMRDSWLRFFRGPPSLRTLIVEYETLTWKKNQMDPIIARNKKFKLPILQEQGQHEVEGGGRRVRRYLSAEDTKLEEWKWKGPSNLGGGQWRHHGDGDTVEYVVVVDRWRFVEEELSEDESLPEDQVAVPQAYVGDAEEANNDEKEEGHAQSSSGQGNGYEAQPRRRCNYRRHAKGLTQS